MHDPKQPPEAASEVFEPSTGGVPSAEPQRIVEQRLPSSASPVESDKTKLPFSSQQLKAALAAKTGAMGATQGQQAPVQAAPAVASVVEPISHGPEYVEGVMDDDIRAFEEAVGAIETPGLPTEDPIPGRLPKAARKPLDDGFFASFEEFLLNDASFDPDHVSGDMVEKMRLYHERRAEGKEPMLHAGDAQGSLKRRMRELQVLEGEWQSKFQHSKDIERSLQHLESEIDERTSALRELLVESRHLAALAREAPEEQAFLLRSGDELRSLGALRHALVRMGDTDFFHHVDVGSGRNDFSSWILSVFADEELARAVADAQSRQALIALLGSYFR